MDIIASTGRKETITYSVSDSGWFINAQHTQNVCVSYKYTKLYISILSHMQLYKYIHKKRNIHTRKKETLFLCLFFLEVEPYEFLKQ